MGYCSCTVYVLKNIKNGSHGTIHTFKNYFVTVLSVFSFQFSVSATINSIQTDPITTYKLIKSMYTDKYLEKKDYPKYSSRESFIAHLK